MNPAINEILNEQERQRAIQKQFETKPTTTPPPKIDPEAEALKKLEEDRQRREAERIAIAKEYFHAILVIQQRSSLSVLEFFSALTLFAQSDALLRTAMTKGEFTHGIPDANSPALPFDISTKPTP